MYHPETLGSIQILITTIFSYVLIWRQLGAPLVMPFIWAGEAHGKATTSLGASGKESQILPHGCFWNNLPHMGGSSSSSFPAYQPSHGGSHAAARAGHFIPTLDVGGPRHSIPQKVRAPCQAFPAWEDKGALSPSQASGIASIPRRIPPHLFRVHCGQEAQWPLSRSRAAPLLWPSRGVETVGLLPLSACLCSLSTRATQRTSLGGRRGLMAREEGR